MREVAFWRTGPGKRYTLSLPATVSVFLLRFLPVAPSSYLSPILASGSCAGGIEPPTVLVTRTAHRKGLNRTGEV